MNEEGTEAAAATGVGVGLTSAPLEPVSMTVDKPFLYFIIYCMETQYLIQTH